MKSWHIKPFQAVNEVKWKQKYILLSFTKNNISLPTKLMSKPTVNKINKRIPALGLSLTVAAQESYLHHRQPQHRGDSDNTEVCKHEEINDSAVYLGTVVRGY